MEVVGVKGRVAEYSEDIDVKGRVVGCYVNGCCVTEDE